jgi:glycosyltransferase involved in cell wall biosynthesis
LGNFYVLGEAHSVERNEKLKQMAKHISNIKLLGFQDGSVKADILSKAWILVNCSRYECLPVSFLEALSYKCAILSTVNPDSYTSMFGNYVEDQYDFKLFDGDIPNHWGTLLGSDLIREFNFLLDNDRWRELGETGYKYVKDKHSTQVGVDNHLKLYEGLLNY